MEQRILAFVICLAVVFSGCAMEPRTSGTTTISTPAAVERASELPSMYGPLERQHRSMRPVEEAFIRLESLRSLKRLTVADLKPIKNIGLSAVLVTRCNLSALKSLIASDWAPVVIIRSPVGPKHVRVVAGYDDDKEQIILADPMDYITNKARLTYSEFSRQWDDPQKACLLIFRGRGGADMIKNDLRKYLTRKEIDSLTIR